ncbi:hypothetical protein ABE042_15670 [Viridibacillus arvi]|uniref:hypothetical protein n=1 Tax=Viridibacillus arvi TaxID=263475 RepID=UPI003D2D7D59
MKKIDWKTIEIKPHHIVIAHTSEPDYEMSRQILLEIQYDKYVILEGSHCSFYDFDDTEREAIEYSGEELRKIANAEYNKMISFGNKLKHMFNEHSEH